MKHIQTIIVGSGGAANIEFTSIPQAYTDLLIMFSLRSDGTSSGNPVLIALNGSTANFSVRYLYGAGNSAVGSDTFGSRSVGFYTSGSETANTFASGQIIIPNYGGSTNKSIAGESAMENNGAVAYSGIHAVLWANTSAITSIALTANSGNWVQYSSASLYGITKA